MNFQLNVISTIIGADEWPGIVAKTHDIETGYHIHSWGNNSHNFEPSLNYDTTSLVFMIPQGCELSFLDKIVLPFDRHVWFFLVAFIILSTLIIVIIKKIAQNPLQNIIMGRRTRTPIWNLLNLILNGAIDGSQMPRTNFARFALLKILTFSLVLRSAYTGSLYGFVERDIRVEPITKISDIFDKNFSFYVSSRSGKGSGYLVEFDYLKIELNSTEKIFSVWSQLLTNPNFKGVFSLDLDIVLYRNARFIKAGKTPMNYLNENIMTNPRIMAFPRNSQMASKVSQFILRFQENGLILHWKNQYIPKLKPPKQTS